VVALFCITALPALASRGSGAVQALLLVMRWIALAVPAWLALSAFYRIEPRRDKHFGRFGATYGPLAGVIVLLVWLYVSSFVVLLGAEISAASRS